MEGFGNFFKDVRWKDLKAVRGLKDAWKYWSIVIILVLSFYTYINLGLYIVLRCK